jgi:uncharacterized protein
MLNPIHSLSSMWLRKNKTVRKAVSIVLMTVFTVALTAPSTTANVTTAQDAEHASRVGEYSGYSEAIYTETVRTSEYITVRDGTRIAVDIIRPSVDGVPVEEPLPIILTYERYHRAIFAEDGQILSQVDGQGEAFLLPLLEHGYIIATADIRGAGASFGSRDMEFMDTDSTDAYDVIEWLGEQPWSNGSVGMYDFSYPGITQYMAAGSAPPALKAIIPQNASLDLYSFFYPGGIFNQEFVASWTQIGNYLDNLMPPVPVDADTDGSMAVAAQQEHLANAALLPLIEPAPFRDDEVTPGITQDGYSAYRFIDSINQFGVAVYHIGGWYDGWPRDAAVWFNNLTVPQRLLLTPFSHQIGYDAGWLADIAPLIHDEFIVEAVTAFHIAEHLRFFDYHLKGIENGIMDEPPVWYYTMGAPEGEGWRSAESWPLPNEVRTNFYLTGDTAESVNSVNDGLLVTDAPTFADGQDDYTVDYTTTMGTTTRWVNMHAGAFDYSDMTANDEHALTYTGPVLTEDVEVTGHPIVHLWVTSTADDGDFFVYLSEVDEIGYAHYLTEGALRASHRALSEAPYNYMGLPYHRSFAEDVQALPAGEPVELVFDLLPTSNLFDAGHRIRVTIMGADADTFATPQLDPAPMVSIYHSAEYSSYIDLPIIPAE